MLDTEITLKKPDELKKEEPIKDALKKLLDSEDLELNAREFNIRGKMTPSKIWRVDIFDNSTSRKVGSFVYDTEELSWVKMRNK